MRVGIVGFAGSGKTTLFNTLTGLEADTGFGRKDKINTGVIDVPDERLDKLTELVNPRKTVYAKITFTDVPGNTPESGSALDAQMLQEIRNVEALVHVVRAFNSDLFAAPPAALKDVRAFEDELKIADQILIERRLERMVKEKGNDLEKALFQRLLAHLEGDQALRTLELNEQEQTMLSGYRFVSQKPIIVVLNVDEDAVDSPATVEAAKAVEKLGFPAFAISARLEAEIAQLEPEEQAAFLAELGLSGTARNRFIQAAYAAMELISFLTQGPDEVRAWTIKRGTPARRAARAIHSDLERGFIRAEVIAYDAFITHGSEAACKEVGKFRLEGKEYIVHDGDIMHIRANV